MSEDLDVGGILDAIEKWGSERAAARALGIAKSTFQDRAKKARGLAVPISQDEAKSIVDGFSESVAELRNIQYPISPEGIIARRAAALRGEISAPPIPEIGRPPEGFIVKENSAHYDAQGNVKDQWVRTGIGTTDIYEVRPDHFVKEESAYVRADGSLIGKWVKTKKDDDGGMALVDALKAAFAEYDGGAPVIEAPVTTNSDLLTVYPVADLHYGLYAWGAETIADYDTDIATRVATSGIQSLVAQAYPSEHAVILVLGDYFHQNDQKNATPGSGHRLDVDGRWASVYHKGALLLLEIVKLVAAKHQRVTLKILPGNHDEDAAVTLVVAMSLFFSQEKRITVEMDPKNAWYYRFGKVLIGAHHGHKIRTFQAMAMAMVVDRAQDYGQTLFRHYYSGHIHHKESEEHMGILVESLQSPAAPDAFNYGSGYRSGRSFCAVTFHRNRGRIGCNWVEIVGENEVLAA